MKSTVSILIPHFQTLELTLLCLRLLRKKTDRKDYEAIVIDNGSKDGSGEVIRKIPWIKYVRRDGLPDERPALSHGNALNLGLQVAESPLILTIHTDTMVQRSDWLDYLIEQINHSGDRCAAIGSWKMEKRNLFQSLAKSLEIKIKKAFGKYRHQKKYIRSHCAMYRKEALHSFSQGFVPSKDCSTGEELFNHLIKNDWKFHFLEPDELNRYVVHLNHATMALNANLGKSDRYMPRTRVKAIRRIETFFEQIDAKSILQDSSLDQ